MALSSEALRPLVEAVAKDSTCKQIIRPLVPNGLIHGLLRQAGLSGQMRNMANMEADRTDASRFPQVMTKVADIPQPRRNGRPVPVAVHHKLRSAAEENAYSPQTQREMCFGLQGVVTPIIQKTILRTRASADRRNPVMRAYPAETNFGHTATCVVTADRGEYVIDWWMTLEINNPMIWVLKDWQLWPGIPHGGVLYKKFKGYS